MKIRILKSNNLFYIQKRIFHFLLIEWWIPYNKISVFNTIEQAKEKVQEIKNEKLNKKDKEDKEIFRYDI